MDTHPCTSSPNRHAKLARKPRRGFLTLPGEVRNMVYQYYFQGDFRCEISARNSRFEGPKQLVVTLCSNMALEKATDIKQTKYKRKTTVVRFAQYLGKYDVVKGLQTTWLTSLFSLHLVCKLIYVETVAYIYSKTEFCFQSPKRIYNFLDVVSQPKLQQISRLELHYHTYGHPQASHDTIWQHKHHDSWMRACNSMAKALTGLKKLTVYIYVHESAPKFSLREKWVSPVLQFRRLTCISSKISSSETPGRRNVLQWVKIVIRTPLSKCSFQGNLRLVRANADLHLIFGRSIRSAILGMTEQDAMAEFEEAWKGKYSIWRYHLGFASTGW